MSLIGYLSLTEGLHLRCIYVRQPQQLATCACDVKHENSTADAMGANRPFPENEDIMKCGDTCFFSRKILLLCIRIGSFYSTQLSHDLYSQCYCCAVTQICADCEGI